MLKKLTEFVPMGVLSLIFGKLLGDGNLTIEKQRQPRFRFQHCYSDHEWCNNCYESLKAYIPLAPPKKRITLDSRLEKGYSESVYVQSKTSPLFGLLKQLWYQENKKVIPLEILSEVLDEAGLAWWYQDDGHLAICNRNRVRKIILSSDNFSYEENTTLIELLKQKFQLTFSLDGQNRLCLYNQKEILFFLNKVRPLMHSSMNRKLYHFTNKECSLFPHRKRTTISLPTSILVKAPTKDIIGMIESIETESFLQNWFNECYRNKILNLSLDNNKYQINIEKEQLIKIDYLKKRTGLTMNEIVYLASQID
ncbi:hypothetical protein AM500_22695 [Bacillus sp. FJAT-18017]|uniref:hypothetical protein n=1 Tax=Bacillus sp. FJAT-18017 TaxID=1705566 RepID=UPI0006AE5F6F|nr:hypothetical protein [Bacillus sp. FJAT-18017]ALC92265.1 hypothetical protein AM500_22695 [Bacillus sp. FJAT-18017]